MLTNLPDALLPTGLEAFSLMDGTTIQIPKATPTFETWRGEPISDDRGKKPVLDWRGEPVFAELAILKMLQSQGWEGVWVDTYSRADRRSLNDNVQLPDDARALFNRIRDRAGKRGGCFDVFAWHNHHWLFAEAKRQSNDSIKPN